MTARLRALVQRPRRKVHFATLGAGDASWLTLCDRELPVEGTAHRAHDWEQYVTLDRLEQGALCRRCYWPLVLAGIAVTESRLQWELEAARLRAVLDDRPRLAVLA